MPFQITGEKAIVSDSKFIPAEQGIEDICTCKSCIVMREGWLRGPMPQRPPAAAKECADNCAKRVSNAFQIP